MSKCTRCGKERVVASTRKEKVGNSVIVNTLTVCPDPKCQKIVNGNLKKEEMKRAIISKENEQRALQRAALKSKTS